MFTLGVLYLMRVDLISVNHAPAGSTDLDNAGILGYGQKGTKGWSGIDNGQKSNQGGRQGQW